ncbi:hypothetical protein NB689_002454 [Xanthomonas sacchari]|nr:hypothetical protein [Xanthomonas sacchari]
MRQCQRLRAPLPRLRALGHDAQEWVVEQAQCGLEAQHAAHRVVQPRHRHRTVGDQARQVLQVQPALHADVHAGQERQPRRVARIAGVAVRDQFQVAGVVGDDQAAVVPLAAQHLAQQPGVGGGGHAGQLVEGGHGGHRAGAEGGLERREIHLAQGALGDVDGVVVQAGLGRAVGGEVLGAGGQRIGMVDAIALEAAHAGLGETPAQQHVLAAAFHAAAPARIAGDVDHRREGPVDPDRAGFQCGGTRGALRQLRLEAGGFAQRHREHGGEAVDYIGGEQHRDLQPALQRGLLQLLVPAHVGAVEDAGQASGARRGQLALGGGAHVDRIGGGRRIGLLRRTEQGQLPGLLFRRHPRDQRIDEGRRLRWRARQGQAHRHVRQQRERTGAEQQPAPRGTKRHRQIPCLDPDGHATSSGARSCDAVHDNRGSAGALPGTSRAAA